MKHELVYAARIAEAHFDLGRVHIRIHQRRVEFQEQHVGRMAVVMQHVVVGLAHCMRENLVAHETAVDEKILRVARAAGVGRLSREPMQAQARAFDIYRERSGGEFLAEHRPGALVRAGGLQMPLRAAIVGQHEAHVRPRQRQPFEGFFAVRVFGLRAAQKFAPRRRIEVQVGRFDDRTDSNGGRLGC